MGISHQIFMLELKQIVTLRGNPNIHGMFIIALEIKALATDTQKSRALFFLFAKTVGLPIQASGIFFFSAA